MFLSRLHSLGTELADLLMSGVLLSKSPTSSGDLLRLVKSCPNTRNKYTHYSVSCVRKNSSPEMWTHFLYISITISKRKF